MSYDVIVIGGGPAGLSAAVQARVRGKSVLVVSSSPADNPLGRAPRVDNYLGLPGLTGTELLERFGAHADAAGVERMTGRALSAMPTDEGFFVAVGSQVVEGRALILACGAAHGTRYPGESEYLGRGVSYCATCDGMLYRGKSVVVVGYTDSARQEADFLSSIGCSVTYFEKPKSCVIEGAAQVERVTVNGETAECA